MKIAITAATGQLGRLVVAKLKTKLPVTDIIALARAPGKASDLGVAVREADYGRPETLPGALDGISDFAADLGQRDRAARCPASQCH